MYSYLSRKISNFYIHNKTISEEDREIYEYSFEIFISSAVNLISILILSLVFREFIETIFYLIGFLSIRRSAGGYHCNTHAGCFFTLLSVYGVYVIIIKFLSTSLYMPFLMALLLISIFLIFILSPVEDQNKPITDNERRLLRKKLYIVVPCISAIIVILATFEKSIIYGLSVSVGMATVSFSLVAGRIKNYVIYHK